MDDAALILLHQSAKEGNEAAVSKILNMFEPLIYKHSIINGMLDEDCYQELKAKIIDCIYKFDFIYSDDILSYLKKHKLL